MALSISELVDALPVVEREDADAAFPVTSNRPLPTGVVQRLSLMGGLQAKIAVAYGLHWLRSWFQDAAARERDLAETHFRSAVRMLDSMGYLRGAVMKIGQTLANMPDFAPQQMVETLEQLHFQAPSMHFGLLREMVVNELGDEPENVFAEFNETAFAAASLGQVHRARLKTGEEVAVKIQYPGIAKTIRTDFRNLIPLLLPARLTRDWENLKEQVDFLRRSIEQETDYVKEAGLLEKARGLFYEEEGIVVPRVYPEFSSERVLTMDFIEGDHIDGFLARNPSQETKNEFAIRLIRSSCRLLYQGRMNNVDWHPGNFLFLPDGRLGLIDFGCVVTYENEALWEQIRIVSRALMTGREAHIREAMKTWSRLDDGPQLDAFTEFGKWAWRPLHTPGPFDYGNADYLQEGIEMCKEMAAKRWTRNHPTNLMQFRWECSHRMMSYRLGACVDSMPIMEEEIPAAGWDRSDFV